MVRRYLIYCGLAMLVFGCGSDNQDEATNDPLITEEEAWEPCDAELSWKRDKKLRTAETDFKLGNSDVHLSVNNFELTTEGDFTVKKALKVETDDGLGFKAIVDMRGLKALQADSQEKLSMVGPNYLHVDKYPEASLELCCVDEAEGTAMVRVHLKDVARDVEVNYRREGNTVITEFEIDAVAWGLINPKVIQEIEKDVISVNVKFQE